MDARRPWLWRTTALAPIVLALGAAPGCGGGHGASASPARPTDPAHHVVYLEDRLGFDQDGIAARASRVEARVRDCMTARGFRYVPVDPVARRTALTGAPRLSDDDFVRHFGYGVSTLWGRGDAGTDRNLRIRAALPAARRRAYDRALWGAHVGASFQMAADSGDFTALGGCTRRATLAVFGGAEVLTRLVRALDALDRRVAADSRMVRALRRWRACMAGAGLRYGDPDDIDLALLRRMRAIVGPVAGPFTTGPPGGRTARPYDRAALGRLQRIELTTARRDLACEHRYVAPVEARVRPPYEAAFRARHPALIRRVKPVR